MNTPTDPQTAEFADELSGYAKEPVTVEYIAGTYYAFGSELACLRIFYKYNMVTRNPRTDTGFSKNRNTFYFRLETA